MAKISLIVSKADSGFRSDNASGTVIEIPYFKCCVRSIISRYRGQIDIEGVVTFLGQESPITVKRREIFYTYMIRGPEKSNPASDPKDYIGNRFAEFSTSIRHLAAEFVKCLLFDVQSEP